MSFPVMILLSFGAAAASPSALVANPDVSSAPQRLPNRVEYEHRSWGAIIERWTLEDGRLVWEQPEKPAFRGGEVTILVKRSELGDAERRVLAAAFSKVRASQSLADECDLYIPDGPYGVLRWATDQGEEEMRFTASCVEGPNATKAAAAFAVGRIVSDAVEPLPVIGTRVEQ